MDRMRLDKWLWAARFFKTRSLATHEVDAGRVLVGGQPVKPAREIAVDDLIEVRRAGSPPVRVRVRALSLVRGPAPKAALLYEETPDSVAARDQAAALPSRPGISRRAAPPSATGGRWTGGGGADRKPSRLAIIRPADRVPPPHHAASRLGPWTAGHARRMHSSIDPKTRSSTSAAACGPSAMARRCSSWR